jgi:hypothetical protein
VKTLILTITILAFATVIALAQGKKSVVIGTMIDRPNAVLVINPPNKDQGFLLPQLTSTERKNISPTSPQDDGLVVYDITDKSFYYWSGGSWIKGLGDDTNRSLTYDAATQILTLGAGNTVSLSTLKEVPSPAGQAGKFLTTDGTTLSWATLGTLGDITSVTTGQALSGGATSGDINLSVNTDGTTISVNGSNQLQLSNNAVTSTKIAANAVNGTHIIDGSVTSAEILDNTISTNDLGAAVVTGPKIANAAVGTTHLTSGGNNKVLTTDAAGAVNWTDRSTFVDDNQNLTLTGNTLNIDNGTGANLNNITTTGDVAGALNALVIQPGSVNSAKIQDGTVATTDITTGGNNKVLTTDAAGVVNWVDRSTFVDDNQNLGFAGSTLTIDNGSSVTLSTSGQVSGQLDNLIITPGTSNQVMTTNAAGTTTAWATPGGDVIGPVGTSTVGRIQGRDVSATAPNLNDALIWNGSSWAPGNAAVAVLPTVQFYGVDPANFQALEPSNGTNTIGLFTTGGGSYVFAKGNSRQIMAPVNLPHGATIQSITVFYEYTTLLGLLPFNVNFDRKPYNGGNDVLSTVAPLLSVGVFSVPMPGIAAPDAVIDNSTYTYRIHITFNNILDTNDANGLARIYGIRIQYTK